MRNATGEQLPVIVIGRGFTALGVLRCLHLAGIDAHVACPPGDYATRSRWYRPTPGPRAWRGELGAAAEEILAGMPVSEAVLIPAADDVALWVAELPASLRGRFHVSTSSRQTLDILQDKSRFGAWLAANSIPHPRTYSVESAADIDAIPFNEMDKVFMKPVDSQRFSTTLGIKALWARDRREFEANWRQLRERGLRVLAQEYVPGGFDDHYFIDGFRDRDGSYPGLFARRRRRIYPPDFGNSSYCESIPFDVVESAWASLSRMLSALQYRGIFSAEFKRDARDGQFKILEVNTRAWWYVEFAARCGVNVCEMAVRDACGLPTMSAPGAYAVDKGSVNFSGDLKTVLRSRHGLGILQWKILWQWLHAHYLVFRLDDPRPGIAAMRAAVTSLLRNRIARHFRHHRVVQSAIPGSNESIVPGTAKRAP